MKRIVTLSIASLLSTFVLAGCMGDSPSASHDKDNDVKYQDRVFIDKNLKLESVRYTIKNTGQRLGWIMTDFKSNSIIAENVDNNTNKTVTITYDKSSFQLEPDDPKLRDAILYDLNHPAKRR